MRAAAVALHRYLDVGELDPGLIRLDPDLIDDPFDRDQRFHRVLYKLIHSHYKVGSGVRGG